MMKCAACGTTLEPSEVFCGECGQSVKRTSGQTQGIPQPMALKERRSQTTAVTYGILILVFALIFLVGGGLTAWLWFWV